MNQQILNLEHELQTIIKSSILTNDHKAVITQLSELYIKLGYLTQNVSKLLNLSQILINFKQFDGYVSEIKIRCHLHHLHTEIITDIKTKGLLQLEIPPQTSSNKITYVLNFLNQSYLTKHPSYYILSDHHICELPLPYNFGWVKINQLAGSSIPSQQHLQTFVQMGIKHIITCLESPLPYICPPELTLHFFPVDDRRPPKTTDLTQMLKIISYGQPTVVHCLGGRGRTNLVLIAHYIQTLNLDSGLAINLIKDLRPSLILDNSQLQFIKEFTLQHFQNYSPTTDVTSTTNGSTKLKTKIKLPKMIIFVGLQASGKSTLRKHFCQNLGDQVIHINKDEQKHDAINIFQNHLKTNQTILVDCCNLTQSKRLEWLNLGFNQSSWCIFMDTPFEDCRYRITRRKNHETIREGSGIHILESDVKKLEPPTLSEGYKQLYHLSSESQIDTFIADLGLPPLPNTIGIDTGIIKFPRTKHLVNLGSATRDDLLLSPSEQQKYLQSEVEVHEKVDGANLGFSINDQFKVIAQNRSHYVSSADHAQFKPLDKWIAKHQIELESILEHETEILYGEWLYMKHSIAYTNLPDYFLAFDLFNRKTGRFLSRQELEQRLKSTTIQLVPLLAKQKFKTLDEIKRLVQLPSQFYNGLVEGVYLRICDQTQTQHRAKIVRQDFICGHNTTGQVRHWTHAQIVINKLSQSYA